jgi:hypothetical protein
MKIRDMGRMLVPLSVTLAHQAGMNILPVIGVVFVNGTFEAFASPLSDNTAFRFASDRIRTGEITFRAHRGGNGCRSVCRHVVYDDR